MIQQIRKVKEKLCPVARRELIVEAALKVIAKEGVAAMTMDKVVAQVPYSKGTVYNHFSCKEDLLMGIGNNALVILVSFFKKAATFQGSTRERMLAINLSYLIYAILHPDIFQSILCIKSPTVVQKASQSNQDRHTELELQIMAIFNNLITEALDNGELSMAEGMSLEQVSFANWAMNYGTIGLLGDDVSQCQGRNGLEIDREYFNHNNIVLDGLGWKPLRTEKDYRQSARKILSQLFSEEIAQIAQSGRLIML